MKGLVGTTLTILTFVVLAAVGDLLSEEIRTRLDQIPRALVRVAARLTADVIRDEMREEWLGELHVFLHDAEAVPITRLLRGLRYAFGVLWVAPIMARKLGIPSKRARRRAQQRAAQVAQPETTPPGIATDNPPPRELHDVPLPRLTSIQPTPAGSDAHLGGTEVLTERQHQIMAFIRSFVNAHGFPPTVREIGTKVGLVSPSSVAYQLRQLERKGLLRRDRNRPPAARSSGVGAQT